MLAGLGRRDSGGGGRALLGGGPGDGDLGMLSGLTRSGISRGPSWGRLGRIGDDGGLGADGLVDIEGLSAASTREIVAVPVLLGCLSCVIKLLLAVDVVDVISFRSEDARPFEFGETAWVTLSWLDGGNVKLTGGGDFSRVYGGEEGSDTIDAAELTSDGAVWCIFSCRGSSRLYVGLQIGDDGKESLSSAL